MAVAERDTDHARPEARDIERRILVGRAGIAELPVFVTAPTFWMTICEDGAGVFPAECNLRRLAAARTAPKEPGVAFE
jgi:hypothetical protein